MPRPFVIACLCALFTVLPAAGAAPNAAASVERAPVLLISLDGFRWDYLTLHPDRTPHLRQLAAEGVTAHSLIPVFPSNTFPNHYAIVTGLYPSHSGIINNHIFDPRLGQFFHYNQPYAARDGRWWGGEPIWITAVKQGRTSACSFWPGSEAEIEGTHATWWKPYNYSVPFEKRLEELVGWLKLPVEQRPAVITFYLEEANSAGHRYGPDAPEMADTLSLLDNRIGAMQERFAAEHVAVNFVIVSDHGMTSCGTDRVLILEDYLDLKRTQVDFDETVGGFRPQAGETVDELLAQAAKIPRARAFRSNQLPAHLHVDAANPRVPPVWVIPDEGWQLLRRLSFERLKDTFLRGQHGYDPELPSMHGVFIASGPAFRRGVTIPDVENVHIYNLLCATAGLKPVPNDGDDRLVRTVMKQ
jgi:predicted AlkP superfamily pyrophosphatase or phosphodiesterase